VAEAAPDSQALLGIAARFDNDYLSQSQREIVRAPYVTQTKLAELERRLSERDRSLIETLDRLRVATTVQLRRLHFADLSEASAARQAPKALGRLASLRILTQLPRQVGGVRAGSGAAIWSLDVPGQRLASACGPAGGQTLRKPWAPSLAFLAHRLEVSDCYVSLVEATRAGRCKLLDFEAEPLSWRRYAAPLGGWAQLKPDAFCRLAIGDFERGAFVEIDRATEAPSTIKRKVRGYRHYWQTGREQERRGYFPQVVFAVPSEARKEVLVGLFGREPEESWPLYRVVLADHLTDALTEEAK
jgi:hypothetical protein